MPPPPFSPSQAKLFPPFLSKKQGFQGVSVAPNTQQAPRPLTLGPVAAIPYLAAAEAGPLASDGCRLAGAAAPALCAFGRLGIMPVLEPSGRLPAAPILPAARRCSARMEAIRGHKTVPSQYFKQDEQACPLQNLRLVWPLWPRQSVRCTQWPGLWPVLQLPCQQVQGIFERCNCYPFPHIQRMENRTTRIKILQAAFFLLVPSFPTCFSSV